MNKNSNSQNTSISETKFWNVLSPVTINSFEKIIGMTSVKAANQLLLWQKPNDDNWAFTLKRTLNLKKKKEFQKVEWKRTWIYDVISRVFKFKATLDENDNFNFEDDITDPTIVEKLVLLSSVAKERKSKEEDKTSSANNNFGSLNRKPQQSSSKQSSIIVSTATVSTSIPEDSVSTIFDFDPKPDNKVEKTEEKTGEKIEEKSEEKTFSLDNDF